MLLNVVLHEQCEYIFKSEIVFIEINEANYLDQCSSNFNVHMNHLETLLKLKYRLWFNGSIVRQRLDISNKLLGDADATDL